MTKNYLVKVFTNEGLVKPDGKTYYYELFSKSFATIEGACNFIREFDSFPRYDFKVYNGNELLIDTMESIEVHKQVWDFNNTLEYRLNVIERLRA